MCLGQLNSGIDTKHVDGLLMNEFLYRQPLPVGDCHDIGQIDLALTVVGPDLTKSGEKKIPVNQVDAGIDFLNTPLLCRRVLFFDNRQHRSLFIAENPSIPERCIKQSGHQSERGLLPAMCGNHGLKSCSLDKRGIAAENHYQIRLPAGFFRAEYGMARAQLLFLDNRDDWVAIKSVENLLALMADNHRAIRDRGLGDGMNHMVDHRLEKDLVQHLGAGGFHAGAFTGGENNSSNRWFHNSYLIEERIQEKWATVEKKEGFDKRSMR